MGCYMTILLMKSTMRLAAWCGYVLGRLVRPGLSYFPFI